MSSQLTLKACASPPIVSLQTLLFTRGTSPHSATLPSMRSLSFLQRRNKKENNDMPSGLQRSKALQEREREKKNVLVMLSKSGL